MGEDRKKLFANFIDQFTAWTSYPIHFRFIPPTLGLKSSGWVSPKSAYKYFSNENSKHCFRPDSRYSFVKSSDVPFNQGICMGSLCQLSYIKRDYSGANYKVKDICISENSEFTDNSFGFKIDLDDTPFRTLDECASYLLDKLNVKPALLLQTRPRRYHVVFIFNQMLFQGTLSLAHAYNHLLGGDEACFRIPHNYLNFKVPGSLNPKEEGHVVTGLWLIDSPKDLPSPLELFELIHGQTIDKFWGALPVREYDEEFNLKRVYQDNHLALKYLGLDDSPSYYIDKEGPTGSHGDVKERRETAKSKLDPPFKGELPDKLKALLSNRVGRDEKILRQIIASKYLDSSGRLSQLSIATAIEPDALTDSKQLLALQQAVSRFIRKLKAHDFLEDVEGGKPIPGVLAKSYKAKNELLEVYLSHAGQRSPMRTLDEEIQYLRENFPLKHPTRPKVAKWFRKLHHGHGLGVEEIVRILVENNQANATEDQYRSRCKWFLNNTDPKAGGSSVAVNIDNSKAVSVLPSGAIR